MHQRRCLGPGANANPTRPDPTRLGFGVQVSVVGGVVFIGFGSGCPPFDLRSEDLAAERGLRAFFVGVVGGSAGRGFSEPSSSYQTSTVKS